LFAGIRAWLPPRWTASGHLGAAWFFEAGGPSTVFWIPSGEGFGFGQPWLGLEGGGRPLARSSRLADPSLEGVARRAWRFSVRLVEARGSRRTADAILGLAGTKVGPFVNGLAADEVRHSARPGSRARSTQLAAWEGRRSVDHARGRFSAHAAIRSAGHMMMPSRTGILMFEDGQGPAAALGDGAFDGRPRRSAPPRRDERIALSSSHLLEVRAGLQGASSYGDHDTQRGLFLDSCPRGYRDQV